MSTQAVNYATCQLLDTRERRTSQPSESKKAEGSLDSSLDPATIFLEAVNRVLNPTTSQLITSADRRIIMPHPPQMPQKALSNRGIQSIELIQSALRRRIGAELAAIQQKVNQLDPTSQTTQIIAAWLSTFTKVYRENEAPPLEIINHMYQETQRLTAEKEAPKIIASREEQLRRIKENLLANESESESSDEEFFTEAKELSKEIDPFRTLTHKWNESFATEAQAVAEGIEELSQTREANQEEKEKALASFSQMLIELQEDMHQLEKKQRVLKESLTENAKVIAKLGSKAAKLEEIRAEKESGFISSLINIALVTALCVCLNWAMSLPVNLGPLEGGIKAGMSIKF